jgi:sugar phosphate permease
MVAFFSYLLGGPLADRFKPRVLMSLALLLTALGGVYMATFPSYENMKILFGFWGFTTIFLFWPSLIKATRIFGGENHQGLSYGILDGGRGLVGVLFSLMGVGIYSSLLGDDAAAPTLIEKKEIFSTIILSTSIIVALIGIVIFQYFNQNAKKTAFQSNISLEETLSNLAILVKNPAVWLLMVIIVCAYVGYKITDIFTLYANEIMQFNELNSAKIGSFLLFLRPITGISIGLIADRSRASIWMIIGFILMAIGALTISFGIIVFPFYILFFITITVIAIGTYAVRTLYFATFEEAKIPLAITGTAIGLISLMGYTPDIFASPLMGYLLDNSPGIKGFQHVFAILFLFSFIGIIAAIAFHKIAQNKKPV